MPEAFTLARLHPHMPVVKDHETTTVDAHWPRGSNGTARPTFPQESREEKFMIKRHLVSAGAAVALAAAPAHAAVSGISCTGWQHATYDPGVTNTEQLSTVTYHDYLNIINGYSPTGSCIAVGSTASTGEQDGSFTGDVTCNTISTHMESDTYSWNDGESSTMALSAQVAIVGSNTVITLEGTVTAGEFSGGSVLLTLTAPSLDFANCSTPGGVTTFEFAETLTIVAL